MTKQEISIIIALMITIAFSICTQNIKSAQDVQANTLRLHIIANSDSPYDQNIKLVVRDGILAAQQDMTYSAENFEEAVAYTAENLEKIQNYTDQLLSQYGADYKSACSLEQFCFDTTQYSGFVLPKGKYTALTVRLGAAQGKNWWCVVYPALCSQMCGKAQLENCDSFIKTDRITLRFKLVEIYEDIKSSLFPTDAQPYTSMG